MRSRYNTARIYHSVAFVSYIIIRDFVLNKRLWPLCHSFLSSFSLLFLYYRLETVTRGIDNRTIKQPIKASSVAVTCIHIRVHNYEWASHEHYRPLSSVTSMPLFCISLICFCSADPLICEKPVSVNKRLVFSSGLFRHVPWNTDPPPTHPHT